MMSKENILDILKVYVNNNINSLNNIIFDLIVDPLRVIGFNEEINSNLWFHEGENIQIYYGDYHTI